MKSLFIRVFKDFSVKVSKDVLLENELLNQFLNPYNSGL